MCFDGVQRLCHIRGKMRKKVWVGQSDIILVGLRDYQDAKADVILKYSADEARNLKSYGEFPETVKINETVTFGEEGYDDDDDDDTDSMDVTGDSDDDDDDDDDTDSDDSDDDSDDDDSNDDSGDDSDDSNDSIDAEDLDTYCATLEVSACYDATDDDGNHYCAINQNTQSCYGIVASDGIYGKGNFDTGYTAAQAAADAETQQLNTIVGVLGGIVGLLVILAAAGGYYFYTKQKETAADAAMPDEVMSVEHDDTVTGTAGMEDGTALMDDEE